MKVREYLLTEERADYTTDHLQDVIRNLRNGIEDIFELFDDIEDKRGMIQTNKMRNEWKVLEKMVKPFVYNMDKIHQFRDELNGVVSENLLREGKIFQTGLKVEDSEKIQDSAKKILKLLDEIEKQ